MSAILGRAGLRRALTGRSPLARRGRGVWRARSAASASRGTLDCGGPHLRRLHRRAHRRAVAAAARSGSRSREDVTTTSVGVLVFGGECRIPALITGDQGAASTTRGVLRAVATTAVAASEPVGSARISERDRVMVRTVGIATRLLFERRPDRSASPAGLISRTRLDRIYERLGGGGNCAFRAPCRSIRKARTNGVNGARCHRLRFSRQVAFIPLYERRRHHRRRSSQLASRSSRRASDACRTPAE